LAATASFAQSTVELYGRLDLGYASSKTTTGGSTTKVTSLAGGDSQRTSDRIGLKGTEDLGGGLKASFNYEFNLTPDATGATDNPLGGVREGFLALSGGFGSVKFGTMTNVFDGMVGGTWNNATGLSGGNTILVPGRTTNTIAYTSPAFNGFTAGLATYAEKTSVDGAVAATGKSEGYILSANYANGPLNVAFGYGDIKGNATLDLKLGGYDSTADVAAGYKIKSTAIKASYDVGVAVPYVLFADNDVSGTFTMGGNSDTAKAGFRATELGATFPMGAFTPFVSMVSGKSNGDVTGFKYSGYEAGVTYALSKRTTAYVTLGQKKVKDEGETVYKKTATAIGVAHTF
jgi:predicted porin